MESPQKYTVLIWGATPIDKAIYAKILKSKLVEKIYVANGDDYSENVSETLKEKGFGLISEAKSKGINLIISNWGANDSGIIDAFQLAGIKSIGVNKYWMQLESSKSFGKQFMDRNGIPTAKYKTFTDIEDLKRYLTQRNSFPVVIKADGYTRGWGVSVCYNYNEAVSFATKILNKEIPTARKKILAEDFLTGTEVTLMCFFDGKHLLPMLPIKDYKKMYDNNLGPNTGSMGSYAPLKLPFKYKLFIRNYLRKLKKALIKEHANFKGVIYSGLIINDKGLYVLELNMRFGDPEGQVILKHLNNDLMEIFQAMLDEKLNKIKLKYKKGITCAVNIVKDIDKDNSKEHILIPEEDLCFLKENEISVNLSEVIFKDNRYYTNCFEIITLLYTSDNPFAFIYDKIKHINIKKSRYRSDIGR